MSGYKPKTTTYHAYCNPVHNSGNKDSGNNTFAALHTIAENNEVTHIISSVGHKGILLR